jgi:hypothetical protein
MQRAGMRVGRALDHVSVAVPCGAKGGAAACIVPTLRKPRRVGQLRVIESVSKRGPLMPAATSRPKHEPWDSLESFESKLLDTDRCSSLHEAYKRHSTELASLEDRLNKTLVLILGFFGASVTAVSAVSLKEEPVAALCFAVIVVGVMLLGLHVTNEAGDLRKAVRDLLVRCELAMQFYTPDVFVKGKPLYGDAEREYSKKGGTLTYPSYVVIILTACLLLYLIWSNYYQGLPKKP